MKNALMLLFLFFVNDCLSQKISGTVYSSYGEAIPWVKVKVVGTKQTTRTNANGYFEIKINKPSNKLEFSLKYFETQIIEIMERDSIDVLLPYEDFVAKRRNPSYRARLNATGAVSRALSGGGSYGRSAPTHHRPQPVYYFYDREDYAEINENGFKEVLEHPLSTFSVDVDAASYSNMRRYVEDGLFPPKNAIRIEEMINYFDYDYQSPTDSVPFSISTEVTHALWNEEHYMVQIGLQGKEISYDSLPPSNLVFLIDVSGSMQPKNKLPLIKSSLKLLVSELRPFDLISIVAYAGRAGIVLPPTSGAEKEKIKKAIKRLHANGATAGGKGIKLAYDLAKENFLEGKNNRVILATDGDFNVGVSSKKGLENLIQEKREEGIFLTVLGFGQGNLQDAKMELLADKGNGNYAYIDNLSEAKKVLINEFGGTLFTIAKDVKMQVEFNPAIVQAYRLIGYENRKLDNKDFNNDKKDAGDIGSGHSVTALYEVVPKGVRYHRSVDKLKYQFVPEPQYANMDEMLTVKFRYKEPDGDKSKLLVRTLGNALSENTKNVDWAMGVAGFGMLLRGSEYAENLTYADVYEHTKESLSTSNDRYKSEFLDLVDMILRLDM